MNKNEASQLLKQLAPDGIVYDKDLSDFESKLYPFKIIGRVGGPRGGPNDYTHNCELVLHRQWHYEMFSELLKDVNCVVKDLHGIRSEQGCLDSLPDSYVVIGYGIEGNHREKALDGVESIDVTSRGNLIQLSPFYAGPVNLYDDYKSQNVENAWQYSKAYAQHFDSKGLSDSYWNWAEAGWKSKRAERYPMGKDAKPKCSIWNKKYLDYVQARIKIYWPLYSRAV